MIAELFPQSVWGLGQEAFPGKLQLLQVHLMIAGTFAYG